MSVCPCVCLSVSVQATTFEWVDPETSFLVWCYILTMSRSSLSIKVIGLGSSSKKILILYWRIQGHAQHMPPQGSRFFHFDIQNFRNVTALGDSVPIWGRRPLLWEILDLPLFWYLDISSTWFDLSEASHKWGQGYTKVKVIPRSNCKCLTFYWQTGGGPLTERHSSLFVYWCLNRHLCDLREGFGKKDLNR